LGLTKATKQTLISWNDAKQKLSQRLLNLAASPDNLMKCEVHIPQQSNFLEEPAAKIKSTKGILQHHL
jgi:hypothetical protein